MSKFLTGKDLEDTIYDIIWHAENVLLIVSPFIKLGTYFKELFNKHENNPKIHLILVFGKNENEVRKSMSKEDFDYFKKFLKVSIIHVPNLHAKYYGNEKQGVITSVNLYDYSFANNIEFGVFSKVGAFDKFISNPDQEAWLESMKLAETNNVVFIKRPVYEQKKLVFNLTKNYIKSDVLIDSTDRFYGRGSIGKKERKKLRDFPEELILGRNKKVRPEKDADANIVAPISNKRGQPTKTMFFQSNNSKHNKNASTTGHCLRCSSEIKYNVEKPYCYSCYTVWSQYSNPDFEEQHCHSCGKNNQATMNKPECYNCYKKHEQKNHAKIKTF